jgi:hypothetical protein
VFHNFIKSEGNSQFWKGMKINCHVSVKIINQTEEEMLDDIDDDGRIVFGTEEANKRLP